MNSNTDAS